jgi:transposase-like protein
MLGLSKNLNPTKIFHFSEAEKRAIVEDYLQSGLTKREIWEKYTGRKEEHGTILRWMYAYGYVSHGNRKSVIFAPKKQPMIQDNPNQESVSDFEFLQLKKRISELEKQLQESEMKAIAWQTMVEIAEREFNISIKKKYTTKPSKK